MLQMYHLCIQNNLFKIYQHLIERILLKGIRKGMFNGWQNCISQEMDRRGLSTKVHQKLRKPPVFKVL